jgi:hypothetical protein
MQYNFLYVIIFIVIILNIINENVLRIAFIIISILMISIYIYKNKTDIMKKIDNIGFEDKSTTSDTTNDNNDDNDKNDDGNDKDKLSKIESELKKYEKYSSSNSYFKETSKDDNFIISKDSSSYKNAENYYKKLNKNIDKLKGGKYKYIEYNLDSLMDLLNKTCNAYQSISITIPPNNIKNALKTDDFSIDKKNKKLHKLVNDLYNIKSKEIHKIYKTYNNKKNINQYHKYMYSGPEPYIKNEYNLY